MAAVCGGMDLCKDTGRTAAAPGAIAGDGGRSRLAAPDAENAEDRGVQFTVGVSRLDGEAQAPRFKQNVAQPRMDGRGIRALPEIYEREYWECRGARWPRKFSLGATAGKGCAIPDRSHRGMGIVVLRARAIRIPPALHGAAARQQIAGRHGESL